MNRDNHCPHPDLDLIVASRRQAESAIALAMITSLLPGLEVQYVEPQVIDLPASEDPLT